MARTGMIRRSLALVAVLGLVAAACAAPASDDPPGDTEPPGAAATCPEGTVDCDDTPTDGVPPPPPPSDGDQLGSPADGGVRAVQIDGVWVFEYTPGGGMDALHSGTPEIVDGCLVIDDTIVVWDSGSMDEAAAAIAAVRAGESPQLLIGGGGLSIDEGTDPSQFPDVITERCGTRAVWFASP